MGWREPFAGISDYTSVASLPFAAFRIRLVDTDWRLMGGLLQSSREPHRDDLEDELLAIGCLLGEREAFDRLIERWHQPLWLYVRRVTGSDDAAADALQETWLRVPRGIARLREPARLRAWLFGIARRTVMDRLRQKYAEPERATDELADLPAPDDPRELEEEMGALHEELARLPFVEREVLVLFYLDELTLQQLADVLGIPVGTVKSRLFRARGLLRRQLVEKGVEP